MGIKVTKVSYSTKHLTSIRRVFCKEVKSLLKMHNNYPPWLYSTKINHYLQSLAMQLLPLNVFDENCMVCLSCRCIHHWCCDIIHKGSIQVLLLHDILVHCHNCICFPYLVWCSLLCICKIYDIYKFCHPSLLLTLLWLSVL